ncbi:MAG: beta-ketoacyl synthase N-terminal-like domain-containing protein [Kineosporiaceae bacterium]
MTAPPAVRPDRGGETPARRTSRAALAGCGAVSSIGRGVEDCFSGLLAGRDGLADLRVFDRDSFGARSAYEIDDRPDGQDRPWRATALLVEAVAEACAAAGIDRLAGVPVLVGTGLREMRTAELAWLQGRSVDPRRLHFGPALADAFGADDVHTFSNACSASLYAAGLGLDLLGAGHDAVVVAGVDVLTASMFGLLDRVHLEAPERVRPFDAARRGVLIGEGSAAVVLTRGQAAAGGTTLRAVALGCDAYHVTAPDPAGIEHTMRSALAEAAIAPGDVDVVYTHGTGTLLNDDAEATALGRVFSDAGARPVMAAVKSMTGHTSGGSGLFSLVMAERSLHTGDVPGVLGLDELCDAAAGLRLSLRPQHVDGARVAQVDAFGFGGLNAVAVLGREGPA